jgi:hypothetical protein
MPTLRRLQLLLLQVSPTTIRPALLVVNLAALALALHTGAPVANFSTPLSERWG